MGMQEAVRSVFQNYVTFSGRARRAEYWWFILFAVIVSAVLGALDSFIFGYSISSEAEAGTLSLDVQSVGVLAPLWSLATFLPSLAVAVRRLHDTGRSGWWLLILLVPLIGAIVLLVFLVTRGNPGTNVYGTDPIAGEGWT